MLAFSRSAVEITTRFRMDETTFGICFSSFRMTRSANFSRSDSVHSPPVVSSACIANRLAGKLLQLNPINPGSGRCARRINSSWLAKHNRGIGWEKAASRLVYGSGNCIQAAGDVHDSSTREAVLRVWPSRGFGLCQVNLHITAPIAKVFCLGGHPGWRDTGVQQLKIELLRSYVANDRATRSNDHILRPDAHGPAAFHFDTIHVRLEFQFTAAVSNRFTSESARRAPPPLGTGIPPSSKATAINLFMNPEHALSGLKPVCKTQGASKAWT
jgi:hypothetical protein